ncbi:hypothetical protein MMC08_009102, partial [Hypocenomyce scalaris]|nr:hypothetical protein [Hypocenomyce scalaris]
MSATGFPMEKPLEETTDTVGKALSSDRNGSPQTSVWPGAALKPKPLFHGQQRSSSAGSIPQRPSDNIAPLLTAAGNPRDSFPFPSHRSEFPRSVSLASRSSGVAPDGPVPPLPANVRKSNRPDRVRVNAAGSPSRTSVGSCGSGHSSILQDRASQATSQAETDFTSLNLLSPHSGLRIYDGSKIWDSSRMSSTATSPGPSTTTNIQTQFLTQRSFRASIEQYSLPRSTSSGLSMSLLDEHTPKAESKISKAGSISRSLSVSHSARNLEVPKRNLVRQQSARERTLASLTSNRNSVFNIYDDVRNKRASTSILQDVSGNEGSPLRNELGQRPTSIATSNPFQWDPATSMKPEQLAAHKGWRRGHKRQNCVRISNITPRSTPGRFLPTLEEPAEQSRAPDQKNGALHRPPSQPTFDPTIRPPSRSSKTRHPSKSEGTYSPTLAMVNLYSSDSGSSDSSTSNPTPTRKPSHRRTPSQRRRNLFSSASKITAWPAFSTPSKGVPKTTLPPSLPENQTQSPDLPTPTLSLSPHPFSAPSNFFRNNRNNHPNESSIRGPRAPPSPVRMYQRTTGTSRAEKRLSPMRDLRRSVMALRRMNSEVSESEARASQ